MKGSNFIMNKNAYNPFIVNPLQRTLVYCQNVLPLAFDNSMSYYEFLCAMNCKVNEIIKAINNQNLTMVEFQKLVSQEVETFEKYVNDNFSELTTNFNEFKAALLADFETFQGEMQAEQDTFEQNINTQWTTYRTAINQSLSDFASQIDTIAANVATNATDISALQNRVTTDEGNITQNASDISTLSGRVTTAEGNITQNTSDISENALDIAGLDSRVTTLENATGNMVGRTQPENTTITIDNVTYTAGEGSEYFNNYEGNNKNNAFGSHCAAFGSSNNVLESNTFATGSNNSVFGINSFAAGYGNEVNGNINAVFGSGNVTSDTSDNQLICGEHFDNSNDDIKFAIGNGTAQNPSNAFAVDYDGYIFTPETPNGYIIKILTQTEYNTIQNPDTRTIYIIVSGGANT